MDFDIIFQHGKVIDGTRNQLGFVADVGVVGDRIVAVGDLSQKKSQQVIDATDRIVCPGFIDVHVHSEISLLGGRDQHAGVIQGVTTQLLAPDGFGWVGLDLQTASQFWQYTKFAYADFPSELAVEAFNWQTPEAYLEIFAGRTPTNVCPQVPHCTVRLAAMGWEDRPAAPDELKQMEQATRSWMEAGATGICLGLDYQPGANADLNELVTLCRLVQSYGGLYAAHIRYELLGRQAAWEETLEICRQAEIPVHISHERVDEVTQLVLEQVDREDLDLTFESYLYPAGMTHLAMRLPMDLQTGSPEEMIDKLKQPAAKQQAVQHLSTSLEKDRSIIGYTQSGRYIGMTLQEAAESVNQPIDEFAYNLVVEEEGVETLVMFWQIPEEKSELILNRTAVHPRMMIASDGVYEIPHPHPRGYGCFAQFGRKFVRERQLLSWEEAIWKMSGFPAERFGLKDRGQLKEGLAADIVVFDPETLADKSTWSDPLQPAVGVEHVLVNGQRVIADGAVTDQLPGRVLRRS